MATSGRFLENLTTYLQRRLAPIGAVVKSPERFYRNGKQIGEVDVTIRGRFGAATVFVGIECRDRPSEGPQGMAWIQVLAGKKQLLGVDKLVAVSSTGFLPEATVAARECGIDLFTMTSVSEAETHDFLRFSSFSICIHRCEDIEADLHFPAGEADPHALAARAFVIDGGIRGAVPLSQFLPRLADMTLEHWDPELKVHARWEGVTFIAERQDPLRLRIGSEEFESPLTLRFKLWREVAAGKVLLFRCDDSHSGAEVASLGVIRAEMSGRPMHAFFSLDPLRKDSHSALSVQFSNPDGSPFFPEGTPIVVRVYSRDTYWGDRPWTRAPMGSAQRVSVVLQLPTFVPK